jgi:hypothetical protein
MSPTKLTLAVLLSLLLWSTVQSEPVELFYDSGNGRGFFNQVGSGDIEAVRFTPAHPCSLLAFRFRVEASVQRPAPMEWHIWGDNGGNMCDPENDLIEPIDFELNEDENWVTIDVSEAGLTFDIPQHFHIGHVQGAYDTRLLVDGGNNFETRSHLRIDDEWYVTADGSGNYLLRALVEYYDEIDPEDYLFTNVNEEAGVRGFSNISWGDYDNDGWEDILVNGSMLFHNLRDGAFEEVAGDAGIVADNPANSGNWGDFDNDGWLDIYCTNSDLNAEDRLYHNNRDGTFSFVNDDYWLNNGYDETQACGWGDADNDGFLDLYIANSELWNDGNPIFYRDYLYHFIPRDQIFMDITPDDIDDLYHYGRGVAWCDFDMDGDMDIYISNYRLHPNYLLVNQGNLDFREQASHYGVKGLGRQGAYGHTIGSAWGDYDNDLDFDLFVGNLAHPRFLSFSDKCMLYNNGGEDLDWEFVDVREGAGIAYDETASSPAWGDFDNDGWLDLFVTSVYEGRQPYLYRNNRDGTFTNVNYPAGFHMNCYNSWGVAWCDYDHDGDLDVVVGGNHGGLFQNNGDVGHYLQVELRGVEANRFAFGCQAEAHEGDLHLLRQVEGGTGTGSCQNMMTLHFGLGGSIHDDEDIEVDSLLIRWLGGDEERYFDIPADHRYIAVQGEGLLAAPLERNQPIPPVNFRLDPPYPNPFNSAVNIEFYPGAPSDVKITVYDLTGRRVAVLADSHFTAATHRLTWGAADMPAGSYIVQARFEGGVVGRKVDLIK